MNLKEIRKAILEVLYEYRQDVHVHINKFIEELKNKKVDVADHVLHGEVKYLQEKGYLETSSEFMGQDYLYFAALKITAYGIDLVEDPEDYNKLFAIKVSANSFGDISNSNLSIDSSNIEQVIKNNKIDDDLKLKLKELEVAIGEKNKSKILKIMGYIGDKSVDLLIAIIAAGIK